MLFSFLYASHFIKKYKKKISNFSKQAIFSSTGEIIRLSITCSYDQVNMTNLFGCFLFIFLFPCNYIYFFSSHLFFVTTHNSRRKHKMTLLQQDKQSSKEGILPLLLCSM